MKTEKLSDDDYRRLLEFRNGLRRFLKWSADRAREAGLSPAQHQLLLAVRGEAHPEGPTIGDIASHLLVRHNSAVELVDRCQAAGLVKRDSDPDDHRAVRVRLTDEGVSRLESLSGLHLIELRRLAPQLAPIWEGLEADRTESS